MAKLTESQKHSFATWTKDALIENKAEIEKSAKEKGVKFDTKGHINNHTKKRKHTRARRVKLLY